MTDRDRVLAHLVQCEEEGTEMSDGAARVVASWWHSGQASPGYAFVSTGAITDPSDDVWRDLTDDGKCYSSADPDDRRMLDWLGTYLVNASPRGPQEGWSALWV